MATKDNRAGAAQRHPRVGTRLSSHCRAGTGPGSSSWARPDLVAPKTVASRGCTLSQMQGAAAGPSSSSCDTPDQVLHEAKTSAQELAPRHFGAGTRSQSCVVVLVQGQAAQAQPYLTRWCTAVAGPPGIPALLPASSGGSSAAGGHCRRSREQGHQMRGRVSRGNTPWLCLCSRQGQNIESTGRTAMAHTPPPSMALKAQQLVGSCSCNARAQYHTPRGQGPPAVVHNTPSQLGNEGIAVHQLLLDSHC